MVFVLLSLLVVEVVVAHLSLRARQIHQIELPHPNVGLPRVVRVTALDRNGVNRMRARGIGVHFSGAHVPEIQEKALYVYI